MTLPNGYHIGYEYDDARRLRAIKNDAGERIEYTVDAAGNRTQQVIKNSSGTLVFSAAQAFDELSRVLNATGNHGQQAKHTYDANDNDTSVTDGRNNKTQQQFDELNRVKKIIDPNLKETQFTYDTQNRINTVTDARGNKTTYLYDGLGNLRSQTSPDTGTTTFTYDAAGNRTGAKNARQIEVIYDYDALNRLTSISYPAAPTENVTYTYDSTANGSFGVGRLASITNNASRTDYEYNGLGLIRKKTTQIGYLLSTTRYSYDLAGNLSSVTYPSGRVVNWKRDAAGRVQNVTTQTTDTAAESAICLLALPTATAMAMA
jgi:YD repeat-containing protein